MTLTETPEPSATPPPATDDAPESYDSTMGDPHREITQLRCDLEIARSQLKAATARIEFLELAYHRCCVCKKMFADEDALIEPHCDDCDLTEEAWKQFDADIVLAREAQSEGTEP